MKGRGTKYLTQGAMIAAVYVVLSVLFAAFGSGQFQVRIAEALTILPWFTPAGIPGLFVGCLVGNLLNGSMPVDVIFGSLATLVGAVGTRLVAVRFQKAPEKIRYYLAIIPPILSNGLIVPLILKLGYGINLPYLLLVLSVGAGEIVSCGGLGLLLGTVLKKYRGILF